MLNSSEIYRWPRYSSIIESKLAEFARGESFDDWNLGDIYTEVPQVFSKRFGQKFGIFTSSGTSALHAALIAANLPIGSEVIVPSMTFIRAVTPLVHVGLSPVLCDVDPDTGNIDPSKLEDVISSKTKAVIVVHMWGVPCELDSISQICKRNNLLLIEDCSHAHGSELQNGRLAGSYGDFSFLSLQRKKLLSVGEGGLLMTSCDNFRDELKEITSPGSFETSKITSLVDFSGLGLNLRMSPFSAVVAKALFQDWEGLISDRERIVSALIEMLDRAGNCAFKTPKVPRSVKRVSWYSLTVRVNFNFSRKIRSGLWSFRPLNYPCIFEHKFWEKLKNYHFGRSISPIERGTYSGQREYMANRMSIQLPNYRSYEWTAKIKKMWESDLQDLLQANDIC